MTLEAPAARARATSRGSRTPPSAQTWAPTSRAAAAHSKTAENCGRPTPVCMRVVHIAPGPTPTLMMSAPAAASSRTPSAVTILPAAMGSPKSSAFTLRSALSMLSWCPCAVSMTRTSAPACARARARPSTSPLMPTAAPTMVLSEIGVSMMRSGPKRRTSGSPSASPEASRTPRSSSSTACGSCGGPRRCGCRLSRPGSTS